ncbi:MAG: cytoplasmic protein [Oscillospiraceae bacterium]|nr:cytoplasmic protein [Oscillospiraceae bacterium]MBQ8978198.1 cytoplasmic protein [Oscillospiraceae bacterium]
MDIKQTPEYTAHRHCTYNREELEKSSDIGCFHCMKIFHNHKSISSFCDGGETALCPYCGIDSLIGSASGYEITGTFLQGMNQIWF